MDPEENLEFTLLFQYNALVPSKTDLIVIVIVLLTDVPPKTDLIHTPSIPERVSSFLCVGDFNTAGFFLSYFIMVLIGLRTKSVLSKDHSAEYCAVRTPNHSGTEGKNIFMLFFS